MLMKETGLYFKRNWKRSILIYVQITVFMLLIGVLFSFIQELDYTSEDMKKVYEGKAFYHMIDDYYSGDAFETFAEGEDSLQKLKKFYAALESADTFTYVTIADQHILTDDLTIEDKFIYGFEQSGESPVIPVDGRNYKPVKALQINEAGLQYFGLKADKGRILEHRDFACLDTIPVVLGSNYSGTYQTGDSFTVSYLNKNIECRVAGILEAGSKVYYMDTPEFYLDSYIIMPMTIMEGQPSGREEWDYQFRNYLNMVNGFLITDENEEASYAMVQELKDISAETGFEGYTFIGQNPHVKKYDDLMLILRENRKLIQAVLLIAGFLNFVLILLISYLQGKEQHIYYYVFIMEGKQPSRILVCKLLEILLPVGAAYITHLAVLNSILIIGDYRSYIQALLLGGIVAAGYVFVDFLWLIRGRQM